LWAWHCLVPVSAMQPHTHTYIAGYADRYRYGGTDTDTKLRPHFADAK